jgi:hypothetical protein
MGGSTYNSRQLEITKAYYDILPPEYRFKREMINGSHTYTVYFRSV